MNILLIVDDYLPHSTKVAAKMMHELALEFIKSGHSVSVLTPNNSNVPSAIFTLDDVKIYSFSSGKIKNASKIVRAANETLLSYRAWSSFKNEFFAARFDCIVYYSPSIFFGDLVKRLKKLWGAPSYLILRDFFPQWVIDNGMLKADSPITKYFRFFERINYEAADTIGVMSQKNKEWFESMTKTGKPVEVLYNWAADDPVTDTRSGYRQKLGLDNKVVFFYGGNIGHAQDMMNIVRLADSLRNEPDAHFLLIGSGDEVELVHNAISEHQLINLTLLPPVSQNEFKQILAEFDIGLFSLHRDHTTHNFPGKLLGYMVQQKPILGSVNPDNDLKSVIEASKAGYISVNGDDTTFHENALRLLHNRELRRTMGENAYALLHRTFSVEAAARTILTAILR